MKEKSNIIVKNVVQLLKKFVEFENHIALVHEGIKQHKYN